MTDQKLDLRGGATHFLRTEGPRGFLLRFAVVYALVSLVLQVASYGTQAPVYEIYLRACIENECDVTPYMDELNAGSLVANAASLVMLLFSLAVWVVFEGASQRRYIRGEGFRLALGADEGRLALVGLIWFALLVAGYFALALGAIIPGLLIGVVAGALIGVLVGTLVFIIGIVAALYLFARLSPASALTIRDGQIRFFEAWNLTKGHGWSLAGSYFLLFFVFTILSLVLYGAVLVIGFVMLAPTIDATAGSETAEAVLATMSQPTFWGPITFVMFFVLMVFAVFAHALGGPAALIVRKRTLEGGTVISETFG